MAQKLNGKSAVITGGGGGIGKATALALAAEGAKVVVNDVGKNPDGSSMADKVVEEIKKAGGTAVANYDNIASMAGGQNVINTALSNFRTIDILVNCAGNYKVGSILDMTEDVWDSIIAVHLKGHFACSQAAAKEMVKQKSGRIINISSNGALNFTPPGSRSIAYATAKAGILGMTATMSAQLMEYGITVNALWPSAVTSLFPALVNTGFGDKNRAGPEYIAPVIVYLASDQAQNVNGQFIHIGGGELCIFNRPMQLPGPHMFVRKTGMWTVDELADIIPSMLGQR